MPRSRFPDPELLCPEGTLFSESGCESVPEELQEDCREVTIDVACGTADLICVAGEPDSGPEVRWFDNDQDGVVDEDAGCVRVELEETCGDGDEDYDGRIDEGLDCTLVDRAEAEFPCDSGNADHEYMRQWYLCPEGYGYKSESCDELASSRISDDACMTVTNEVCGDVIQTTCSQYAFRMTDSDEVEHYTDQIRCGEQDANTELSDADICAQVGLEASASCWVVDTPQCGDGESCALPPMLSDTCVQIDTCRDDAFTPVACGLPGQ